MGSSQQSLTCNSLAFLHFFIVDLHIFMMNDVFVLKVGGEKFTASRATLTKEPDSKLAKMFAEGSKMERTVDDDGAYLIESNPRYFGEILTYLRTGHHDRYSCLKVFIAEVEKEKERMKEEGRLLVKKNKMTKRKKNNAKELAECGWIGLNVRGKKFTVPRDILTVSHKGDSKKHMLHKLVMATNNTTADFEVVGEGGVSSGGETKTMLQDEEGAYIIEANPDYFVHVLDYLRTGELLFDATPANVKIVQAEARYFGLNGLASRCKELLLHLI